MVTFEDCVESCLRDQSFLTEFDRLAGTRLAGLRGRNVVVAMVDDATGFPGEESERRDLRKLVAFVYETIWLRLPEGARAPQVVEPPPGGSFRELMEAEGP